MMLCQDCLPLVLVFDVRQELDLCQGLTLHRLLQLTLCVCCCIIAIILKTALHFVSDIGVDMNEAF